MRAVRIAIICLLCATGAAAEVTFISPQQGSQAAGVLPIQITTTTTNVDRVEFYVDRNLVGVARKPPYAITYDFGTVLTAREVTAKVFANGFRTIDIGRVTTWALTAGEVVNVDFVEVPLRVRAARTLRKGDLIVRENGVLQTTRDLQADRGAARFVFVVDRSLSMGGGRLDAALRAIDQEVKQLRADDTVEAILFNHYVTRPRALARGERVAKIFGDLSTSGGTSLRDAVSSASSAERSYIIVITDGGDRNSATSEENALRRISGTRVVVDSIILGDKSSFLEKAAKNTGGTVASATASTLQRELRRIIADINSRFTLSYQSSSHGSGWRSITIEPQQRDIAILNARKGYFAQ